MIRSPRFPPWPRSTARRLAEASISPNTRRAYSGVIRRLDAWLDGRRLDDAILAAYLAELHDQGRAPASASTAVAAACFRARLAGEPGPAGERTALGPRRLPADRRRARPMASAAVRGRGPRRRPRHLPPAAAPWPRRRVRPRRPRARPPRRRGGAPLHGRDAAERGERPPLGPNGRKPTSPEGGGGHFRGFFGFFWVFLGYSIATQQPGKDCGCNPRSVANWPPFPFWEGGHWSFQASTNTASPLLHSTRLACANRLRA